MELDRSVCVPGVKQEHDKSCDRELAEHAVSSELDQSRRATWHVIVEFRGVRYLCSTAMQLAEDVLGSLLSRLLTRWAGRLGVRAHTQFNVGASTSCCMGLYTRDVCT